MTIFYVYMLECADGSLYTGYTNDLEKRLAAHNEGKASKYTRSKLPVSLVYLEACENKSAALRREAAIKKLPRTKKLALLSSPRTLDPSKPIDP